MTLEPLTHAGPIGKSDPKELVQRAIERGWAPASGAKTDGAAEAELIGGSDASAEAGAKAENSMSRSERKKRQREAMQALRDRRRAEGLTAHGELRSGSRPITELNARAAHRALRQAILASIELKARAIEAVTNLQIRT
ncbi:MAG TPA: hypothetical protein VG028_13350 [Terriglobia bacterium]|nr:hypothetical protein [Terriglobia bacterium]